MKKYIEPKVKAVKLDSEQALLTVCQTGGAFMSATSLCVGPVGTALPPMSCTSSVRSVGGGGSASYTTALAAPS